MLDLDHGPCVVKRLKGCGSGHEYLAVTPEGDLYPCHQFVGMEEFKMGNVNNSTDINMTIRDMFVKQTIYSKPDCKGCWAKFFCSGGCAANAWQFNNCLDKPYEIGCELERKRVECALWAKVTDRIDRIYKKRVVDMITVQDIKKSEEVKTFLSIAEKQMQVLGYTEHSFRHVALVSENAGKILEQLGHSEREVELTRIAGYLHDIGNAVNRTDHAHSGAILAYNMLSRMGMDCT